MQPGEMLDGEGGFAVWAKAIPATRSLALGALPMGLAHNVRLKRPIKKDQVVSYDDVDLVDDRDVVDGASGDGATLHPGSERGGAVAGRPKALAFFNPARRTAPSDQARPCPPSSPRAT